MRLNSIIKLIVFLFVFNGILTNLSAQNSSFVKLIGGTNTDEFFSMEATSDGGFINVGNTQNGITGSAYDMILLKTDANGNTIWNKTFGNTENESAFDVAETNDNGFIIAGESQVPNSNRALVVRTNSTGDTVWTKKYEPTTGRTSLSSVIQTADFGFLFTGWTHNNDTYAYILKTDNFGNILWSKQCLRPNYSFRALDAIETSPGQYLVLCQASSSSTRSFILELNSAGDTLSSQFFTSGSRNVLLNKMIETSDGGLLIGGRTELQNGVVPLLVKLNANHGIVWANAYPTSIGSISSMVELTGGSYIAATKSSNNTEPVALIGIDASGIFSWAKQGYGGNPRSGVGNIVSAPDGNLVGSGYSQSQSQSSSREGFIMKTNQQGEANCMESPVLLSTTPQTFLGRLPIDYSSISTSIGNHGIIVSSLNLSDSTVCSVGVGLDREENKFDVTVYPNPVNDRIFIDIPRSLGKQIKVCGFGIGGARLFQEEYIDEGHPRTLDLAVSYRGLINIVVTVENEIVKSCKLLTY